jgi:hypothetical protein
MLSAGMAAQTCTVSVTDSRGIRHSVEITAESLFEAAAMALAAFRKDGWTEPPGPATRLEIEVKPPVVRHTVTVQQLQRWLDGATTSPNETVRKKRLKSLLARCRVRAVLVRQLNAGQPKGLPTLQPSGQLQ